MSVLLSSCPMKVGVREAVMRLVSFVQFKQREKHPWMSVTFSKAAV